MIDIIKDIWDASRPVFPYWPMVIFGGTTIALALRLDGEKAKSHRERLRRVRTDAAISFAASLERGTEARKFILLWRAGFMHEIGEQFPAFQAHMDARIAAAMGGQP
ncbi:MULTISPECIES: hypothetical protein [Rhizobium/Agrobacterium group]|uniref:Uncharacterized protein n=1 Tax=Allorhizobium ampelinum (strain ATCC BAA-846 / DSM 112012 / S4) TaxID=311402 RepID=B9K2Q5_ALLAM|nr:MULTISPECIES: hypothetical protein [Rhizobium/Agrobacterium group]ACM39153.1 hypothetical protein Avi_6158 [Allorhizobium ampelinum S4]MUO30813.1 hypothetical protein [Agrobacterium vitis]